MKIKTTIGDVWLAADNSGLTAVSFQPIAEGQQANRTNPLPIVIPCHRVIGQNGQLTGYMGNTEEGIAIKRQLLVLEGYFSENEEGVSK